MSRAIGLGLLLLGCAAEPWEIRLKALQNQNYTGDANRDLVPYQARNRDVTDCAWSSLGEVLRNPSTLDTVKKTDGDADVAEAIIFACMAARGWHPESPSPSRPVAAPTTRPAVPAATPPSAPTANRTAARLQELDALRSQRLITEEEYQATRKRILQGL